MKYIKCGLNAGNIQVRVRVWVQILIKYAGVVRVRVENYVAGVGAGTHISEMRVRAWVRACCCSCGAGAG